MAEEQPSTSGGGENGNGGERRRQKGEDPEEAEFRAFVRSKLEGLTPEQLKQMRAEAAEQVLKNERIEVDGKRVSLAKFHRRVEDLKRQYESGMHEETVRKMPIWQVQEMTPGEDLRPGAFKQQLRMREEAMLDLDRFGRGVVFSPRPLLGKLVGDKRDFSWGIYAKTGQAEEALSEAWAGQDPRAVLADERFYLDVLRRAHQMELTLIALTARPLPLAPMRQQLADKLEVSMKELSGREELKSREKAALTDFISLFEDTRVAPAGWMDAKKGQVKKDTHFLFSTTEEGELVVQAITPGRLKDRKTSNVGVNRNKLLTAAVFGLFLGPQPLDDFGKKDVGHGMLWAANGYRFRPWEAKPDQIEMELGPDGQPRLPRPTHVEEMALPIRPSVFQLLEEQTRPLLGGVRRALRRAAKQQESLQASPA